MYLCAGTIRPSLHAIFTKKWGEGLIFLKFKYFCYFRPTYIAKRLDYGLPRKHCGGARLCETPNKRFLHSYFTPLENITSERGPDIIKYCTLILRKCVSSPFSISLFYGTRIIRRLTHREHSTAAVVSLSLSLIHIRLGFLKYSTQEFPGTRFLVFSVFLSIFLPFYIYR